MHGDTIKLRVIFTASPERICIGVSSFNSLFFKHFDRYIMRDALRIYEVRADDNGSHFFTEEQVMLQDRLQARYK
ncbi:hypothetical protein NTGHW29_640029 [Candidatus Nitrotoga sp. HW29]|nr:hypothetical protein NTGHW29_640029 [Candidatus Nitrotoga sp. HW29]